MTGIELKIAQGHALDASWYGHRIQSRSQVPGRTGTGSIVLPELQEKRLYAKVDEARLDVRKLQKTMAGVGFGVGAGALSTIALAGAIMWTRWQAKAHNNPHLPNHNPGPYPRMNLAERERASETVPEEIRDWKHGRWKSREQAIAVGLSRARAR